MTVRVRPARVAVLIDRSAAPTEFVRVIRFFSQIWGGRYSVVLPVDPDVADSLSTFRLGELRPDFVYGVGINESNWGPEINNACQPRQFCTLQSHVADNVRKSQHEGFIHGDRAVIAMFNARNRRSRYNRPLAVVAALQSSPLHPYCAVMFGMHHTDLADEYRDECHKFESGTAEDFVDLCMEFSEQNRQTWLDANSFGLSSHQIGSRGVEPTIVLVREVVSDLSLFWNKRVVNDRDEAPWIIPVPAEQATRHEVVDRLSQWLDGFSPHANYCVVTSESVNQGDCVHFAAMLEQALDGTSIEYVDYEPPRKRLPLVLPFESRVTLPVNLDGRKLELMPPAPQIFDAMGTSEYWYVDLINDASTRRALLDMQLPSSIIVPDILNGPCPPGFEHSIIKRFADGVDSINARCNSGKEFVHFYVPSPDEILEESLREPGYEIVHDEKRSSYLPTIDRIGSIRAAAAAFSGKSGEILQTFLKGTLLPNRIRGLCRLGGGELPIDDFLGRVERMSERESERIKRIVRRRFEEHAHGEIPESLTLSALLEHWADRSILLRRWELGPCTRCGQTWFAEELNIQRPILCLNCGHRVLLPERLCLAYSLAPPVKHSLEEGLIPVVLAGRFLRNMTRNGFFWLPGVKYRRAGEHGDVDILACCDGHLVFAECKKLDEVSSDAGVWKGVKEQFLELADIAVNCEASLAVLASQVEEYPSEFIRDIDEALTDRIPHLLLSSSDLQTGHRELGKGGWLSVHDLVPMEFHETPVKREGGPRRISFGTWTYTKGS